MQTAHIVFNTLSGSYSTARQQQILTLIENAGISPRAIHPRSAIEAQAVVRELCATHQQPCIIAVGGDGTVNTVLNGLLPQRANLGIIPLGTANVLAYELGIQTIEQAVQRIARGSLRPFTVGEARGSSETRRFLLMAGIGFDGAVVAGVNHHIKARLGKLAYLLAGLRQLCHWDRSTITIDDGERSNSCHSVIIANAAHYGGPYRIARETDIFSPQMEVMPLPLSSRADLLRLVFGLLTNRPVSPARWLTQNTIIRVNGNKPVQLDGDPFGNGPIEIRLIPEFNRLIC